MEESLKYLEKLSINYELIEHSAVFTIEEALAEPTLQGKEEIKNLFIQDDKGKRQYLIMMPGEKRLNLKQLAIDLDEKKVRFCSAEKVERMLGVKPGSVCIFCCLNPNSHHVKVVVDEDLMNFKEVGFHPIVNTATVYINTSYFKKLLESLTQEYTIQNL